DANHAPGRKPRRGDVLPCLAAITGKLNQPVIRANPDLSGIERRRRDGIYHGSAVVASTRLNRQIAADSGPAHPPINRLEQVLSPLIKNVRRRQTRPLRTRLRRSRLRRSRLRRYCQRGGPGIAKAAIGPWRSRRRRNILHLPRTPREAVQLAAGAAAVD